MSKSIGQQLRQAREKRSITLEQAAQATRIRPQNLQVLEAGEFNTLPSMVQARGFLRVYADFLELDVQALLAGLNGEKERKAEPQAAVASIAPTVSPDVEEQPAESENREPPDTATATEADVYEQVFIEIGRRLRTQRELLGLSLDDIERHTHLRRHYLIALEEGNLEGLPSPVQGRGMLNNYASFVGLDPEPLLLRFADGLQASLAARQVKQAASRPARVKTSPGLPAPLRRILSGDILIGGTLAVFLIVFIFWGTIRIFAMTTNQQTTATAPSIADVLLASATPTATFTPAPATATIARPTQFLPQPGIGTNAGPGEALLPVTPGKTTVQVYITVNQRAWLRVIVDGEVEFEGRVLPGGAYTFVGEKSIEILTGNAAALAVFYNGIDLGLLGTYGQVANRIYGPQGILTPTPSITPALTATQTATPSPAASGTAQPGLATPPPLP